MRRLSQANGLLVIVLCLCRAHLLAAVFPSHNFGSVAVNGSAVTYNFGATITGVSALPVWSITGTSFSLGSVSCTLSGSNANCSVPVSFSPSYPGLQQGAVYAKNSAGTLLGTYTVRGVGTGSQLVFAPGIAGTVAGNGVWGYTDSTPANSSFRSPSGLAVDQAGNIYVADPINQVVRKITPTAVTTVAGSGISNYTGDNGPATSAALNNPVGVALDAANNLYIADQGNNVIRRVDAVSGIITTVIGGGSTFITPNTANVPASSATLYGPQSLAIDASGNLFVAVAYYQEVLRVDAVSNYITLYAGNGVGGGNDGLGDGLAATAAIFANPTGLCLDVSGNLYIVDSGHSMIRMVSASTGVISLVAGSGAYSYSGDGGAATNASFESPMAVRVDPAGNLYIADYGNNVIREVLASNGIIFTVAGTGQPGYTGDGALANSATLANPADLALAPSGTLYIADSVNNVIRAINPISPALNFGTVVVGLQSQPQPVMIVNRGNQTLNITGGSYGSGFKQVSGADDCIVGSALQPGATCTALMAFAPTVTGTITGNLSLSSNSLNGANSQPVVLSGTAVTGSAAKVTLSSTAILFGNVRLPRTPSQSFTITNSGSAALSFYGLTLTGTGSSVFSLATSCGATLAVSASCTITLTFTPSIIASYSASLSINDSVGNSPQVIAISGSGISGTPIGLVQQWDNNGILYLMDYTTANGTITPTSWTNTGQGYISTPSGTPALIPLDMNADGLLDLVQQWDNQGVLNLLPYFSNGTTFTSNGAWINTGQGYSSNPDSTPDLIALDINGDGKTDLVQVWNNRGVLYLLPLISNGTTFINTGAWINTGQGYVSTPAGTPSLIVMDINGDGKMDLVQQWDNQGVLYLLPYISNGSTFINTGAWINTGQGYSSTPAGTPGLIAMDFNGDGKTDLVQQWDNRGVLYLLLYPSTGTTFGLAGNWINTGQGYVSTPAGTPSLLAIDMNGDGKTDLIQQWDNQGILYLLPMLSTGTSFDQSGNWINTGQGYVSTPAGNPGLLAIDLNGDGKTDLVQQWNNQGVLYLLPMLSTGTTFAQTGRWINTGQGYISTPAGNPGFLLAGQ